MLPAVLAEAERLGYDGPIPVAGYCASPTRTGGAWVGWSLCSAIPGLGTVAKGLGLQAYGARTLTGVDPVLRSGAAGAPQVRADASCWRRCSTCTRSSTRWPTAPTCSAPRTGGDTREPTLLLDPRDLDAQWALQQRLDAGTHEYFILSPGLVEDRVPILERTT